MTNSQNIDNWILGFFREGSRGPTGARLTFPHPLKDRYDPEDPFASAYDETYVMQCQPEATINIGDSWFWDSEEPKVKKVLFGFRVDDRDKFAVQHGANLGGLVLGPGARAGYVNTHDGIGIHILTLEKRHLYRDFSIEPPNSFKMPKSVETKALNKIKKQFRQGLLETVYVMFRHWENHAEMADRFNPALIEDEQQRQSLIRMNETNAADSKTNAETIAVEYLKIKDDLDKGFKTATTLKQTFEICNRYVSGEFGKDWHLRDYWNGRFSPYHRKIADDVLDNRAHVLERHRMGYSDNYFGEDFLKPLFKRHPKLALIYHVMSQEDLAAHQQKMPKITPVRRREEEADETENTEPDNSISGD